MKPTVSTKPLLEAIESGDTSELRTLLERSRLRSASFRSASPPRSSSSSRPVPHAHEPPSPATGRCDAVPMIPAPKEKVR
jgi:hypothetical protein